MGIKRYSEVTEGTSNMEPDKCGKYMLYEDYAALEARCAEMATALAEALKGWPAVLNRKQHERLEALWLIARKEPTP